MSSSPASKGSKTKNPPSVLSFLDKKSKQIVKKIDKDIRSTRKTISKECNRILLGNFVKCTNCQKDIEKFKYYVEGGVYHRCCAPSRPPIMCCVCNVDILKKHESIPEEEREPNNFCYEVPIYCLDYCKSHEVVKCSACGRPFGESGLPNGELCSSCSVNVVREDEVAQNIYFRIVDFMSKELKLDIPSEMLCVQIKLVDAISLEKKLPTKSNKNTVNDHLCGTLRGLTISNKIRWVSGVFILDSLPDVLCCSVIAHEAMHVWLKLNHTIPIDLAPLVEEGLCQVVAHKYLDYLQEQINSDQTSGGDSCVITSGRRRSDNQERELLRRYWCYQIENDSSEIYGDGYRYVNSSGLENVLNELRMRN